VYDELPLFHRQPIMKTARFALIAMLAAATAFGSDIDRLAADLERALGKGTVEVHRKAPVSTPSDAIVAAMNRERAAYGLPPLRLNSKLSLAAQDRITDMFDQRYFAHVAPDGTQPFVWLARHGYAYRTAGENLAVGYGTAGRVVGGWMNSPGHRANILGSGFDEVGVAIASGAPLRGYAGPTIVAIYASR
jgi:uncharacterized protein YkwD